MEWRNHYRTFLEDEIFDKSLTRALREKSGQKVFVFRLEGIDENGDLAFTFIKEIENKHWINIEMDVMDGGTFQTPLIPLLGYDLYKSAKRAYHDRLLTDQDIQNVKQLMLDFHDVILEQPRFRLQMVTQETYVSFDERWKIK